MIQRFRLIAPVLAACSLIAPVVCAQVSESGAKRPRGIIVGVNGAEWDIFKPLRIRGEIPNLA